jgi:hypothetical protein
VIDHQNNYKENKSCKICRTLFHSREQYLLHIKQNDCDFKIQSGTGRIKENNIPSLKKNNRLILSKDAFEGFLKQYELIPRLDFKDIYQLINYYSKDLNELYSKTLQINGSIKSQICASVLFYKKIFTNNSNEEFEGDDEHVINNIAYFCPLSSPLSHVEQIDSFFDTQISEINQRIEEFLNNGSGWILKRFIKLELHIGIYKAKYGCYRSIPKKLINKKAIINIKSNDFKCFLYSLLAFFHPVEKDQTNISNYLKYENDFNLEGIQFPTTLEMISKFEKNNNLAINVYSYKQYENDYEILPVKISKSSDKPICLLIYYDHFYLIKHFNRLLGNESSFNHYFCYFCLSGFKTQVKLDNHLKFCKEVKPQRIILPSEEDKIMKYNHYDKQELFPFCIYADFECITKKINQNITLKTNIYQEHEVCGYAYIMVDYENNIINHNLYRGRNAAKFFLKEMKSIYLKVLKYLKNPKKIIFTAEDEINFNSTNECYLCHKNFKYAIKCRDHCHNSGLYQGL